MSYEFLDNIKLVGNAAAQNFKVEQVSSDPGSPVNGQFWYNTTSNELKGYADGAVIVLGQGDIHTIASANDRLTVSETDGTVTLTIVESNIVHQNISGAGTNTHAQIDAHIANTSNPHQVTLEQARSQNNQLSGNIDANGSTVTGLATPSNGTDAATKSYVDGVAQGLHVKDAVIVLGDSNVTLSGEQTIDGVLTSTSRVLLTGQTDGTENGIWVTAAGAWARPSDFAAGSSAAADFCFVEQGTTYGDTGWVCTNDSGSDVVGTDSLTFAKFSSQGSITASNGLTKVGNDIQGVNATTSAKGVVELADDTETAAGTSETLAVTPSGLDYVLGEMVNAQFYSQTFLSGDFAGGALVITAANSGATARGDIRSVQVEDSSGVEKGVSLTKAANGDLTITVVTGNEFDGTVQMIVQG